MTSPRDFGLRRNSGDPTEVIFSSGTSSNSGAGPVGFTGIPYCGGTGIGGPYVGTAYATSTPAGTISEETKSPEQVAFEKRKARLISALMAMKVSAPNWSGYTSVVREPSAMTAEKFLNSLPGNSALPKVAPDGEGDVMFVWDDPNSCIVIVEPRMLHLVSKPGTGDSKQVRSQQFLGVIIPPAIQQYIPLK
jgi:hypothetical protein